MEVQIDKTPTIIRKYDEKRKEMLGISFSTANSRLKKNILFDFVERLGLNVCYRCNELITCAEELTVDHKEPWGISNNPVETFYDLNNIGYSHPTCNYSNNTKGEPKWTKN